MPSLTAPSLQACAEGLVGGTAVQYKDGILKDVQHFAGERPLPDDLVLFVISRLTTAEER